MQIIILALYVFLFADLTSILSISFNMHKDSRADNISSSDQVSAKCKDFIKMSFQEAFSVMFLAVIKIGILYFYCKHLSINPAIPWVLPVPGEPTTHNTW